MTKQTSGTVILTGANTYSNGTHVTSGTLKVDNTSGSGTGSGTVTVDGDAVLGGTGFISGAVIANGSRPPGDSPGRLTVNNSVSLNSTSSLVLEIAGLTPPANTTTGNHRLGESGRRAAFNFSVFTPTGHDILFVVDNTGAGATTGTVHGVSRQQQTRPL